MIQRCINCTAPQGAVRKDFLSFFSSFFLIAPLAFLKHKSIRLKFGFIFLDKSKQTVYCFFRDIMV